MNPIKTQTVGQYTVEVHADPEPMNPRENDNLGVMVCFHRRYTLGDRHDFIFPEEFERVMRNRPAAQQAVVSLPLYLYDHSGLDMATIRNKAGWWHWQWDAGLVGYIYITRQKVFKEYGWKRITRERQAVLFERLQAEVDEYAAYLRGEAYGYRVVDADGEEVSSCWGYLDAAVALREGLQDVEYPQLESGE